MAVALATLPLKSRLAGAGEAFLVAATGVGGLTDFATGAADAFAGLATAAFLPPAFLAAGFATGLLAALAVALLSLGAALLSAAFFTEVLLSVIFPFVAFFGATTFFGATAFFGAATFFAGAAFFAGDLVTFPGATALAFTLTAAAGFTAVFLATGLTGVRADFAVALLTLFTAVPFADAAFDAAVLAPFALFESLSCCALTAPELRVVFAISLHRGWPWRPGVIAQVSLHQQACFWNTCNTTSPWPYRQREFPDKIDTVAAPFIQALDQSIAWFKMSLLPQLL